MNNADKSLNSENIEIKSNEDFLFFGFFVFLLSESVVFLSLFVAYTILRIHNPHWYPNGVTGLDIKSGLISTVILIACSCIVYLAERALSAGKVSNFRKIWLITVALGVIFLIGQVSEWHNMPFGIDQGLAGATYYLLTGFHGLHIVAGIILVLLMYFRSLVPGNYQKGHSGVSAVSLFWYFVNIIWILTFILLYLW